MTKEQDELLISAITKALLLLNSELEKGSMPLLTEIKPLINTIHTLDSMHRDVQSRATRKNE